MQFSEGQKVFIKGVNKFAIIVEQISEVAYAVEIDDMEYSASIQDIQAINDEQASPAKMIDRSKFEDFEEERFECWFEEKTEDGIVVRFDVYLKSFFSKPVFIDCSTVLERKGKLRLAKTLKPKELCFAFSMSFADIELKPILEIKLQDHINLSILDQFSTPLKSQSFLKDAQTLSGLSNKGFVLKLQQFSAPQETKIDQIQIEQEEKQKAEFEKERLIRKNEFNRTIDLHTKALGINTHGKISSEIQSEQLELAMEFFNEAVQLQVENLVFIHGIGNGTLRRKLHEHLESSEYVTDFKNEYSPQYGFGATEVNLKF